MTKHKSSYLKLSASSDRAVVQVRITADGKATEYTACRIPGTPTVLWCKAVGKRNVAYRCTPDDQGVLRCNCPARTDECRHVKVAVALRKYGYLLTKGQQWTATTSPARPTPTQGTSPALQPSNKSAVKPPIGSDVLPTPPKLV